MQRARCSLLLTVLLVAGLAPYVALAQDVPWGVQPLRTVRFVPLVIDSEEFFPPRVQVTGTDYLARLDMRRRIVANSFVGNFVLSGPGNGRSLALDQCQENRIARADLPCTPMPSVEIDRLEVFWSSDFVAPESTVTGGDLNDPLAPFRAGLALPADLDHAPADTDSLQMPGAHFRFFSGLAPIYTDTIRWSAARGPGGLGVPFGQGSGFTIDQIALIPQASGVAGRSDAINLAGYERVTGVLLAGSLASPDSVAFAIDPAISHPTIAAWVNNPSSPTVLFYARCGALPAITSTDPSGGPAGTAWDVGAFASTRQPAFLDLRPACSTQWFVVAVNIHGSDAVFDMRVGNATPGREWSHMSVGILEPVRERAEEDWIQQATREAAWRFYGATGGSHLIRSFDFRRGCEGVEVCWRNRSAFFGGIPGCSAFNGATDPVLGSINMCWDTRDFFPADHSQFLRDTRSASVTLAHEFGHLLTTTRPFNGLGDEYFVTNDRAPICGVSGVTLDRCEHSLMARTSSFRIASLCHDGPQGSHDSTVQVMLQNASFPTLGYAAGSPTVMECGDGSVSRFGGGMTAAWDQLAGNGSAAPHPPWAADNFDFMSFAASTLPQIGTLNGRTR